MSRVFPPSVSAPDPLMEQLYDRVIDSTRYRLVLHVQRATWMRVSMVHRIMVRMRIRRWWVR